jgi:tRNA dimethylallyltransferase
MWLWKSEESQRLLCKVNDVIFLMGPTAVGKTKFAIQLCQYLPVEIISVDSAMVYRGMDIGTGKPSLAEQRLAPHHLIDIRDPLYPYSAADFAKDALELMSAIIARGHIPLLVGGTMLYFRALQQGLSPLPSANQDIRSKLLKEAEEYGWACMHQRLTHIDEEASRRIHPNDPQRIQRALEVYEISGKPMSSFFTSQEEQSLPYKTHAFALMPTDRKILHQRIEERFEEMLALGLIDEVQKLFQRGDLNPDLPAIRAVGYRQVWSFLSGDYDFEQMRYKAVVATRQLAKRQLTWLRSLPNLKCLENNDSASLKSVVNCVS